MTPDAAAPLRWQQAVIDRIVARTPRVVSVFFRCKLAAHDAGQHVDVRLTAPDGYAAQRSYSIASAPGSDRLELAIERLGDGEVSPYFHDIAQPGDTVEIRGPIGGHFVWGREDGGPILLIGGGSGVVPLISIIRYRATLAGAAPAMLVYSARTWDDLICRDELVAAQAGDSGLTLVFTTTREAKHRPEDFDRRLDRSLLLEIGARWGHAPRHVYVCGSNAFVESVTSDLVANGTRAAIVRAERYGGEG